MNKTIEITKVVAVGDTIQYEICDSTGLRSRPWIRRCMSVCRIFMRLIPGFTVPLRRCGAGG